MMIKIKKQIHLSLNPCLLIFLLATSAFTNADTRDERLAKFEPPHQKVLMFVGQDNEAVGGTRKWSNGYIDNIGVPAGITHYVYFTESKTNKFGYTFDEGTIDGLSKETTWGAGPMCMACYLSSDRLENTIIHLSISMEFASEAEIAAGKHEHLISELVSFLRKHQDFPFLIRIGYEFDGSWNDYEAEHFKTSWRKIVDALNDAKLSNFATVMASSRHHIARETWERYWPGDEYVDWIGYSYWHNEFGAEVAIELAREKGKPIFIAETTPRGFWLSKNSGPLIWGDWFKVLFDHIEAHPDIIKAVSYINANWDAQDMWTGWGDTRIETNPELKKHWLEKMATPHYVHGTESTYELIGFEPKLSTNEHQN